MDAASLGAIAALLNSQIQNYENEKIVFGEYIGKLPIKDKPIEVTVNKIGDKLLVDATLEEEEVVDAKVTIALNENDDICAIQKGGNGYLTLDETKKALEIVIAKSKELRSLITQ